MFSIHEILHSQGTSRWKVLSLPVQTACVFCTQNTSVKGEVTFWLKATFSPVHFDHTQNLSKSKSILLELAIYVYYDWRVTVLVTVPWRRMIIKKRCVWECVCVCVYRGERELWLTLPVLVVCSWFLCNKKARGLLTYNGNCNLGLMRTWSHKKDRVQEGVQMERN